MHFTDKIKWHTIYAGICLNIIGCEHTDILLCSHICTQINSYLYIGTFNEIIIFKL